MFNKTVMYNVTKWGESVSTKFCRNCAKELPAEAVFCPYCMTKLIDVTTGKKVKASNKRLMIWIMILSAVVIVVACVALIIRSAAVSENTDNKKQDKEKDVLIESTESLPDESDDYSSYMGVWCDEGTNADSIALQGGRMVEIISVDDDLVRFTYTKISSAPHNRIAIISNVNTKIIDGVGTFTFDDDGWGNSGTGKIKFSENEIYLETTINNKSESSMWDIGGQVYLTKDDETMFDFKSSETGLNKDFDEVRSMYGEELREKEQLADNREIHYYDGFTVIADTRTNVVMCITVDYTQPGFTKTSPCYGEINGNSSYDDVYRVHSEPNVNKLSDGYVVYNVDGSELRYSFDSNLTVTGFSLQVNEQ